MTITSYRLDNTYEYFNSVEHREKRFNENKFVEFIEKNEKFYEITYDRS